jgi:hypothetical protein
MSIVALLTGGYLLGNYLTEVIVDPIFNKYHEIKNNIDEYHMATEREQKIKENEKIILESRQVRDRIASKYNLRH